MTIRAGIIGVGHGARVLLPSLRATGRIEVSHIADGGSGKSADVARTFGVTRSTSDWRSVIEDPELELIVIACPPALQAEIAVRALESDRHVLCEKPLATSAEAAEMVAEAARASGRVAAVGYEFRFEQGIAAMRRAIQSGRIGDVLRIDVAWLTGGGACRDRPWSWRCDANAGGGVLTAFGSHVLDYAAWICPRAIVDIVAARRILVPDRPGPDGIPLRATAEDEADILATFDDGTVLTVRVSNSYPAAGFHRIEVEGRTGRLVFLHVSPFGPTDARVSWRDNSGLESRIDLPATDSEPYGDSRLGATTRMATALVERIEGRGGDDLATPEEALVTCRLLEQSLHPLRSKTG